MTGLFHSYRKVGIRCDLDDKVITSRSNGREVFDKVDRMTYEPISDFTPIELSDSTEATLQTNLSKAIDELKGTYNPEAVRVMQEQAMPYTRALIHYVNARRFDPNDDPDTVVQSQASTAQEVDRISREIFENIKTQLGGQQALAFRCFGSFVRRNIDVILKAFPKVQPYEIQVHPNVTHGEPNRL